MAAETREAPTERRTLGDDLAHFCRVHSTDMACLADLASCVSYCGQGGTEDDEFSPDGLTCVVCESMWRAELGLPS